jgi:hypothetical protein
VTVVTQGAKQKFAKGGRVTVFAAAPSGVSSAADVLLNAGVNGVFTILPKASGITA